MVCQGSAWRRGHQVPTRGSGALTIVNFLIGFIVPTLSDLNILKKNRFVKNFFYFFSESCVPTPKSAPVGSNARSIRYFIVSIWMGFVR
jgi:hypothetical protein